VVFLKKHRRKLLAAGFFAVLLVIMLALGGKNEGLSRRYSGSGILPEASYTERNTYAAYLKRHAGAAQGTQDVPVDIFAWSSAAGVTELAGFSGEDRVLRMEEDGFAEWIVTVPDDGFYNLRVEYFPVPSRGIAVERALSINGEAPFRGADHIQLYRVWGDAPEGVKTDNQGNQIRPAQIEKPRLETALFGDFTGYVAGPYQFYFSRGENTVTLTGINEPLVIRDFRLCASAPLQNYKEYISAFDTGAFANTARDFMEKIQGEESLYRSDPSLYAIYDRSSGITEPASAAKITLNMIGGQMWRVAGQWIEWEFDLPEDGMYRFSVKARQNYNRGLVSSRSIYIDGKIPCAEMSAVPFTYSNSWRLVTFTGTDGGELFFPLKKGKHSIRLQVTLGELGTMLGVMEESLFRLNEMYRKILVLTGPEPDRFRDYRIEMIYPELITAMAAESSGLYKLADDLTSYSGERGSQVAMVLTVARQLELFVRQPEKIPSTLVNFKSNISSLGNNLISLTESQLDIDYILVSAAGADLPRPREHFFIRAAHEFKSFIASFFTDYNNLGDVYADKDVLNVWMISGRDQSAILKAMIDDNFTPQTGIRVNVRLVAADAVMPAIVARTGPDVSLFMQQGDPVNYALRGAAADLSKFPGFDKVAGQFYDSAMEPFRFGNGVFALPETQNFNVMFYRRDILEELGVEPPQTWTDLITILPVIQKRNMNIGIPSVAMNAASGVNATTGTPNDLTVFYTLLYQRGGSLYNGEGSRALLSNDISIEAFDFYTKFFTHYKTPMWYDFSNRFRTGEIPLGIADYSIFNTLEIFAPEIRGLWNFTLLPGVLQSDGTINRSAACNSLAAMMFSDAKKPDLAWEFLKWWISVNTQTRFGRELESVMGAAARYPTANIEAFGQLSWSTGQMAVLSEQRAMTRGTPEVPGGYFVNRHIVNAVRRVINTGEDSRETLLDYNLTINDELIKKRKEFGLE